jgi:hypothetical protein
MLMLFLLLLGLLLVLVPRPAGPHLCSDSVEQQQCDE